MVVKRELSKTRYIAAFIIALLIFFLGIFLGAFINGLKVETVQQLQYDFGTQLLTK